MLLNDGEIFGAIPEYKESLEWMWKANPERKDKEPRTHPSPH